MAIFHIQTLFGTFILIFNEYFIRTQIFSFFSSSKIVDVFCLEDCTKMIIVSNNNNKRITLNLGQFPFHSHQLAFGDVDHFCGGLNCSFIHSIQR